MKKSSIVLSTILLLLSSCGKPCTFDWYEGHNDILPMMVDNTIEYYSVRNGKYLIENRSEYACMFHDDMLVRQECIDPDSRRTVYTFDNRKFDNTLCLKSDRTALSMTFFNNGIAWVVKDPAQGILAINKRNKVLFHFPDAVMVYAFHHGYAVFMGKNGKYGIIDSKSNVVVQPVWTKMSPIVVDGHCVVKDEKSLYGVIDVKGNVVVPCEYQEMPFMSHAGMYEYYVNVMHEGKIPAKSSGSLWGVIDIHGETILPFGFQEEPVIDGSWMLVRRKDNIEWEWVNDKNETVIAPAYRKALPFGTGTYAAVCIEGLYGYIDRNGKKVIGNQFDEALPFDSNGYAYVQLDDSWGVIDTHGNWVTPPVYHSLGKTKIEGIYVATKGEDTCILNNRGEIIRALEDEAPYDIRRDDVFRNEFKYMKICNPILSCQ